MTYLEKLKDQRWLSKRDEIIRLANFRCEDCGKLQTEVGWFEVHHCFYVTGREPWEYERELLICCCPECHEFRQQREQAAQIVFAKSMRLMAQRELDGAVWTFLFNNFFSNWRASLEQ